MHESNCLSVSPVTRISGLLSIDVFLDPAGAVCEANCVGEQFRGFEQMLKGRKITDSVYFTQRICGICSLAHGYTAARLVDQVYGVKLSPETVLLQQAMLGAEFLQNHLRHFYLLVLPDYLPCSLSPGWAKPASDSRFDPPQTKTLVDHYFEAAVYSRKCHEMLAVFGGKIPHQHGLVPEGVAVFPSADRKLQFVSLIREVRSFIERALLPDAYLLAEVYHDYLNIGSGHPRFISFGLFDPRFGGHFPTGIYARGKILPVEFDQISQSIYHSWFKNSGGEIVPDPDKPQGYTWVKAPRYKDLAFEGGPLARKIIRSGSEIPAFTGAMARNLARAEEAHLIAAWVEDWVRNLPQQGEFITELPKEPVLARAVQGNDAPRGPLLHALAARGNDIASYMVITPSMWNFSPKDERGQRGPAEESLVGTGVADPACPAEIGRIVRSFDPCLSCGTHVMEMSGKKLVDIRLQA
ncbi:MAG: nickel-dependent hydrogenase large subunit [Bacillota bacterium]